MSSLATDLSVYLTAWTFGIRQIEIRAAVALQKRINDILSEPILHYLTVIEEKRHGAK